MEQKRKVAEVRSRSRSTVRARQSAPTIPAPVRANGDKGNLHTLKRQLVREEILSSAAKLFADRGVRGVSIDDIASALGYTKSSVYYYFKSKDELLWSIFGFISEHFMGEAERIAKFVADPAARLTELIRMHVRFIAEHKEWATIFYRDMNALPADRQNEVRKIIRRYHAIFSETIQDGARKGQMRELPPDIVVNGVSGACNWMVNWISPRHRVEDIAETFVKLFTFGVMAEEPVKKDSGRR